MHDDLKPIWPLGQSPSISFPLPQSMHALTIHRDHYGPPADVLHVEDIPVPRLREEDANGVLVAILATGPNFNTNFAALGLPVEPFGRGDSATLHIPGSDALGIVVDAGPAVEDIKVGDPVILDSWTDATLIRGYETHDGFNAQFAVVDKLRAVPIPKELRGQTPERLAALLLTYGTAYRAVLERLQVKPGDSILLMGGGKGTSFAGAQIAKSVGAYVILMGSNTELAEALIARGMADAFVNRRDIPREVYGVLTADESYQAWMQRTEPFRDAVFRANHGRPVDKIFEHTGGLNFPLLVSALAEQGSLAFFGATGNGLKGEYKETFFYNQQRFVMDARWGWMRQKQVIYRNKPAREIFSEIALAPGKKGVVWGADAYAREFIQAALERSADLVVIASRRNEENAIEAVIEMGVKDTHIIDRDAFELVADMPDPLTEDGRLNPEYNTAFMADARALGRAIWRVFGPRTNPDFIVERTDQSTLHYSSFLVRDFSERENMPCGIVIARGIRDLSVLGSHMYCANQAREVVRLLAQDTIEMDQDDLEIVPFAGLPELHQKMLDGRMTKPKGVALVQAEREGRSIDSYVRDFWGETLLRSDQEQGRFLDVYLSREGIGIVVLQRVAALNALNAALLSQLADLVSSLKQTQTFRGRTVNALILCSQSRAFVAGADVNEFADSSAPEIAGIAAENLKIFSDIENLGVPVVALVDGFALGGGNELAMSAHYRIVTQNALLGQPEVKLGIIPGYGGAQRLPRLVGPRKAVEMAINGEAIDGRTAVAIGLADEFHVSATAFVHAYRVACGMVQGTRSIPGKNWDAVAAAQRDELAALLDDPVVRDIMAAPAPLGEDAADMKKARIYAGRFVLKAIQYGYENGFAEGLKNDARLFGDIAASASGQEWIKRFINKDPQQSAFMTLIDPQ